MGGSLLRPLQIGGKTAPVPVIQGGMGVGVSLSGLAGAVAGCGGIGIISTAQIGYRDPGFDADPIGCNLRAIGEELGKAREIAEKAAGDISESGSRGIPGLIGVNIMVATRQYEDYVKAAVEAGEEAAKKVSGVVTKHIIAKPERDTEKMCKLCAFDKN